MSLPKIDQPIHEVNLLSRDKPVRFRPFLVKEQKLMLMAVESKEADTTVKTVKQVINNCLLDKIDVDELPLVDLETLFLHLRARSMGEVLNLFFKCTNPVTDNTGNTKPCGMVIDVPVNILNDVKIINKDGVKKIMFNDDMGVLMKYPSLEVVDRLMKSNDSTASFTLAAACIDKIFDKESVYNTKDCTEDEVLEFVENLPTDKYEMIEKFVEVLPKSQYKTSKKCIKCGYEHDFVLEGLSDFFI